LAKQLTDSTPVHQQHHCNESIFQISITSLDINVVILSS